MQDGNLPTRQKQVLELIQSEDLSASAIGERLGISRNAVYQHITKLRQTGLLDPRPGSTRFDGRNTPAPETDVHETIEQFRESLTQRLDRIGDQEQELRERLERLATEREQVNAILARLDLEPANT